MTEQSDPGDENDSRVPERPRDPLELCIEVLREIIYGEGLRASSTYVRGIKALAAVGITGPKP